MASLARAALVPFALAAVLVSACAPSGTPAVTRVQEISVIQGGDANSLDPHVASGRPSQNVVWQVAEPLTEIDYSATGEGTIAPVLATSWKMLNDTTWQFKLRENVKFTNGEPFDAAAVKFSIERLADPALKASFQRYAASSSRVDVVDPLTVNITTRGPYPLLTMDLAQVLMVPPKYTTDVGPLTMSTSPVGTGPFKVVEWVKADHITLEANVDYWGGRPKLTKATFRTAPEASTRSAAIQTGAADVILPVEASDVAVLEKASGVRVTAGLGTRLMVIQLDQKTNEFTKNVKVREAMNYAVDKDAIIQAVYKGKTSPLAGQMLSPAYFGYNPAIKVVPYDPERAKRLLGEAGFPNGFVMDLHATRGANPGDYDSMLAVAEMLSKVGIRAQVKVADYVVWLAGYNSGKLSPATIIASATPTDAATMYGRYRTTNPTSMASIPEFDELLRQGDTTLDQAKRLDLLRKAAQVEHDQYLAIWLWPLPNIWATREGVQGLRVLANESFKLFPVSMK